MGDILIGDTSPREREKIMFSPTLLDHVCCALKTLTFKDPSVAKHASNKIKRIPPKDNCEFKMSPIILMWDLLRWRERRKEEFEVREGHGGAFKMLYDHTSSMRVIQGV